MKAHIWFNGNCWCMDFCNVSHWVGSFDEAREIFIELYAINACMRQYHKRMGSSATVGAA